DRGKPDVGGVARDDEKVDALPQPRGRLDELWIDLHRDDRTIVGGDAHGQAAVIPDHHRRIAGVPALGYQLRRELVHTRLEVHRRLRAHAAQYPDGLHRVTAMASISISMPSIAKRLIWMSVLAGLLSLKYSLRTSLTFGRSSTLARYTVTFTTSSSVAPAAASASLMLSRVLRVWATTSPRPTSLPASSMAPCPET